MLRFGLVLVQEFENLRGLIPIENVLELSDGRWDFETHVEDLALPLESNVFGPFHHAREVALWLDVLTDSEVAGALLEERVLLRY